MTIAADMEARINIVTLAVSDLQRSLKFYRDGLGLLTKGIAEGFADHVMFELEGGMSLVLFHSSEVEKLSGRKPAFPASGECILSHAARSREEVGSIVKQAVSAGATQIGELKEEPWGYFGYFKDPDGHLWEILWNPGFAVY